MKITPGSEIYMLGQNIRRFREAKRWTQQDLGTAIDMNRSAVSQYESGTKGEMGFVMLMRFADALDVTPDQLLGVEKEKEEEKMLDALSLPNKKAVMAVITQFLKMQEAS